MRIQVKNKINILTSLLLVLVAIMPINSQTINGFKVQKKFKHDDIGSTSFLQQIDKIIYMANCSGSEGVLYSFDIYGNERYFTQYSDNLPVPFAELGRTFATYNNTSNFMYFPSTDIYYGGLWRIDEYYASPKFKYTSFKDDFGLGAPGSVRTVAGISFFPYYVESTETTENALCYITTLFGGEVRFVSEKKPDSILKSFKFPEYDANADANTGFEILQRTTEILPNMVEFDIWFMVDLPPAIIKLNTKSGEFTRYNYKGIPSTDAASDNGNYKCVKSFMIQYVDADGNSFYGPMWVLSRPNTNDSDEPNNLLMIYNYRDLSFHKIPINPSNSKYFDDNKLTLRTCSAMGKKLYFSFILPSSGWVSENNNLEKTEILIYDLEANTYESIYIPPELVVWTDAADDPHNYGAYPRDGYEYDIISYIGKYKNKDDSDVLGILLRNGYFLTYNPTNSIDNIDEGIFQDIGFRYVYPNPTAPSGHVTADIMCYLPDISKVELGLYNFMGQKMLDLTNQFEYLEATHTINLTFDIPKELSSGVYFLNVRNEDETHTKTVIVVGE